MALMLLAAYGCSELRDAMDPAEVSQLHSLCRRCLWHTLQTCVRAHGIGRTTYVGETPLLICADSLWWWI